MTTADPVHTDLVVIGGGPGGYVAAIKAAQLGLDVALVEKNSFGGTCLNRGCIPSKALLSVAEKVHDVRDADELGIDAEVTVDFERTLAWKDGIVDRLSKGVERRHRSLGVTLVEGHARFEDESTVSVTGPEEEQRITFEHAIIATGSQPIEIPGFAFADGPILDAAQAFELDGLPDRLLIVGAGYIGMELATAFSQLGADVTVIETLDDVLPAYDDDLTRPIRRWTESTGVAIHCGEQARKWRCEGDGEDRTVIVTTESADGTTHSYRTDAVLVAVGRRPVTNGLGLDAIGLEPDKDGFLRTDTRTRTDVETVFAVGDVAGEPLLAHKASAQGIVAAKVAAGREIRLDHRAIPAVVFTEPELATVGLTEAEAAETGFDPVVGEFQFRASGRALTIDRTEGFVRLVGDRESGVVLGGSIVGPEAGELIAEVGLAVETGRTLAELEETVHTHPTLSEAVSEAASNALEGAIHSA